MPAFEVLLVDVGSTLGVSAGPGPSVTVTITTGGTIAAFVLEDDVDGRIVDVALIVGVSAEPGPCVTVTTTTGGTLAALVLDDDAYGRAVDGEEGERPLVSGKRGKSNTNARPLDAVTVV